MAYDGATFMGDESQTLLDRFAEYVRPYPAKVLARTLGIEVKTAENFRAGASWPNARHWKLIVQAFGRDVLAAVFEPELNDTLSRLNRERRQLEERLDEIRKRARQVSGDVVGAGERDHEVSYRSPLDQDLFDSRDHAPPTGGVRP